MSAHKSLSKTLALTLSLLLVFSAMPVTAFAEDIETPLAASAETPVKTAGLTASGMAGKLPANM